MKPVKGFSIPEYGLEVRPVCEADLPALLEVYRQCEDFLALGPVAQASLEMVRADLQLSASNNGIFCGITNAAGEMLGVLDYVPSNYKGDPAAADLTLLMLAAPFRARGMGEAIFTALEQELRKDSQVKVLQSGVQVNNPRAVRFWQRMGFSIVAGPLQMPDGTTCYDLMKELR